MDTTTVQSFSDLKTNEFGTSAKVQLGNGESVFINEDPAKLVGKTVDIEITKKNSKAGREYKIGKIIKVHEATVTASAQGANGNNNGKITWDAYRAMAEAAHELANKLEPDGSFNTDDSGAYQNMDRSTARAAILNTVMIAYSNGKIFVPEDDDMPF